MTKRDVPGFAIGGLSGGEEKDDFWRMVTLSTDHLPREKPRYLMGVGCVLTHTTQELFYLFAIEPLIKNLCIPHMGQICCGLGGVCRFGM